MIKKREENNMGRKQKNIFLSLTKSSKKVPRNNPFYNEKKFPKNKFKKHINASGQKLKISIVVERKKDGKKIIIPLTKYEIFNLSDLPYLIDDEETMANLKLNHIYLDDFWEKIGYLEHDVINDGICYSGEDLMLNKKKPKIYTHYLHKKPKWV